VSRRALVGAFPDRVRISHFTREYMHNKDYRALIISLFTHSSRKLVLRKSRELNMRGQCYWGALLGIDVLVFNARWAMASVGIAKWGNKADRRE